MLQTCSKNGISIVAIARTVNRLVQCLIGRTTMCGIVGYVGHRLSTEILIDGLRRLEYRGYDSAGVSVMDPAGNLKVNRAVGRIDALEAKVNHRNSASTIGIGHTRWATHGPATDENARHYRAASSALNEITIRSSSPEYGVAECRTYPGKRSSRPSAGTMSATSPDAKTFGL